MFQIHSIFISVAGVSKFWKQPESPNVLHSKQKSLHNLPFYVIQEIKLIVWRVWFAAWVIIMRILDCKFIVSEVSFICMWSPKCGHYPSNIFYRMHKKVITEFNLRHENLIVITLLMCNFTFFLWSSKNILPTNFSLSEWRQID